MDIRNSVSNTNGGDWSLLFGELWKQQSSSLQERFGEWIVRILVPRKDLTDMPQIEVKKEGIYRILEFLKNDSEFRYGFLSDITATDEQQEPRFRVVYHLFSHHSKARLRLKVSLHEDESLVSLCSLWKGANWAEREVYDMFGIRFDGHPDLRRILMDPRWVGHPLRKDYPLQGYQVFTEPMPVDLELLGAQKE